MRGIITELKRPKTMFMQEREKLTKQKAALEQNSASFKSFAKYKGARQNQSCLLFGK